MICGLLYLKYAKRCQNILHSNWTKTQPNIYKGYSHISSVTLLLLGNPTPFIAKNIESPNTCVQ